MIVALVAGLAAGAIGFFKIQQDILDVRKQRDDWNGKYHAEDTAHKKTKKELAQTKSQLDSTTKELSQTKSDLASANNKIDDLDKKNTDLTTKLQKTEADRDAAQQELARWSGLPDPATIRGIIAELAQTKKARDVVIAENKVLAEKVSNLQAQWDEAFGTNLNVKLPAGLRGTVLAVDPKYDFVVLNVGKDQGALKRGEMMVDRDGRLLGKVRIVSVDKDRCVANILPEWRRGEIREGDEVLY
jgi:uncharacterized membrane-anchored protein YhcB (DUF1043 family)